MSAVKPKKTDVEAAFKALEILVDQMESKQLSLEDSLKCFEHGIKLVKLCQKEIDTAEQKIQKLVLQSGQPVLSDFQQGKEIDPT